MFRYKSLIEKNGTLISEHKKKKNVMNKEWN